MQNNDIAIFESNHCNSGDPSVAFENSVTIEYLGTVGELRALWKAQEMKIRGDYKYAKRK